MVDLKDFASDYLKELIALGEVAESDSGFQEGRRLGLYEAASTMLSQLRAFGVDPQSVGISDADLQNAFLGRGP